MPPPSFTWQTDAPEKHGLDKAKLDRLWADLVARRTTSLLIIRHDKIVFEQYASGWDAKRKYYSASLAKALVGGISLLLAILVDTCFAGGFAIYDAPTPWGPWTTVYFTDCWDIGPGETACFPTKWISPDGRTLYLVFSGNDHFAIRKATLK